MSRDFFLSNRAYQLARLCSAKQAPRIEIPLPKNRARLPERLVSLYALLDRICEFSRGDDLGADAAAKTAEAGPMEDSLRSDLEEFERLIVACRFSSDAGVKQPAVDAIRAIFADAAYFSGLKPLPQYTDAFAYELLFPSWLNLLKASMLPRARDGKPRLDSKSQGELFEFLGKVAKLARADELLLVGYLTFLARRFDAPQCEDLLQRLVDLYLLEPQRVMDAIDSIDLDCKDARQFASRLADYLVVTYSLLAESLPARGGSHAIAYKRPARRPLPPAIAQSLFENEIARDWNRYFSIATPLRQVIESEQALTTEFTELLTQTLGEAMAGKTPALLSLIVQAQPDGGHRVLAEESQKCLAMLVRLEPELVKQDFSRVEKFAACIAARLDGFSEEMAGFFCRALIADANSRALLLACCDSELRRQELSEQLLDRAGKSDDDTRFLQLLACVIVVSPAAHMLDAKNSLRALDAVICNRSIGNKELSDLLGDLHANYSQAPQYLASPMMAAAGKSPRLAALYLTLNEVSQKYLEVGTVDNFSVVRAKYSKLTNMSID